MNPDNLGQEQQRICIIINLDVIFVDQIGCC